MMHSFRHDKFNPAGWMFLVLVVAVLVAHGAILYHLASRDDVGERHFGHFAFAGEASWPVRFRVHHDAEPLPALAGGQRSPHYK